MSGFINRSGTNLNKKILNVNEVTRDETGEISRLKVLEIRDDLPVSNEGTPLNAEGMNNTINEMIQESTYQVFDSLIALSVLTNNDVRDRDQSLLTLPLEVFRDFSLPSRGFCGSYITWNILNTSDFNAFTRDGNIIHIHRLAYDASINLVASIYKINDEPVQKSLTVVVKRAVVDPNNYTYLPKNIDIIPYDVDVLDEDYECDGLIDGTELVISNSHSNDIDLLYRIEGGNLYYCIKGKHDLSNFTYMLQ